MEGDWIDYYCREKLFLRVIDVAQKSGTDMKWKYYQGLGLVLGEKPLEGISCLEMLLAHPDLGLAAAHLSLIAHQSCEVRWPCFICFISLTTAVLFLLSLGE